MLRINWCVGTVLQKTLKRTEIKKKKTKKKGKKKITRTMYYDFDYSRFKKEEAKVVIL